MDAITVMLKVVKFSHFLTRTYNKGMPGDEIRLASLFFDTASRTSKRKRNRRSEYPKALWYAVAEVNTQNLVICQGRGKYSQTTLHEAIA